MAHIDWEHLPRVELPINMVRFNCYHIHPEHVHVTDPTLILSEGDIHVEKLLDGSYYVHNGRHRTLRAMTRGDQTIWARVLGFDRP